MPELKAAIADYFKKYDIKCGTNNVVVRSGIFELLQDIYKFTNLKDDEKILFNLPVSSYFIQECHDNGIAVEFLNTDAKNNWKINLVDLENILAKQKIRILFLNYPNIVSGAFLDRDEALKLSDIIIKYPDLLVVVDESLRGSFGDLNIDSKQFSLGAVANIADQIITIRTYALYT